jgi:hypothetical protein
LAPFGDASGNLLDTAAPAAARKAFQFWQGENNDDYLGVVGAIVQQEMVDWYLAGGEESGIPKPTPKQMRDKADSFYKFSIAASLVSPVAITRMSKYQDKIDYWNSIKAQPGTWQNKLAKFRAKFGDAYMPLTRSTSRAQMEGLDPTMEAFNVMTTHADKVEQLADIDPLMVGVLASTASNGEFDLGVYNYWLNNDMPGTPGETYKSRMTAGDMITDTLTSEMWNEYFREKAQLKVALDALGVASINTKAAESSGVAQLWRDFEAGMNAKYGEVWTALGPQAYADKSAKIITAVTMMTNDEKFMQSELGQSKVWQSAAEYMDLRRQAVEAINAGVPSDQVEQMFNEDVQKLRYSSLGFADFYDRFLQYDALTKEVPND